MTPTPVFRERNVRLDDRYPPDGLSGVTVEATITCPLCGHSKQETMPLDACQFFYRCDGCGETLRPEAGDCCVFCSYSNTRCPPQQS